MNKYIIICFFSMLFTAKAHSQITKGNWLVGGSGQFSIQKYTSLLGPGKSTHLTLSPDIGYFVLDKFAAGLNVFYEFNHDQYSFLNVKTSSVKLGPFLRYYFLSTDNRLNLHAQGAYTYLMLGGTGNMNTFSNDFLLTAEPVLFLNSNVAVELTANYDINKPLKSLHPIKTFYVAVGLQIHLEKDNN